MLKLPLLLIRRSELSVAVKNIGFFVLSAEIIALLRGKLII